MIFRKFRFILLAFCFFLSSLRAETDVDALLGAHQDTVARITGKLPVWNWGWGVQLLAAVLIGLFGLAVSMMKEEEDSNGTASPGAARAKRLRVALGISIGVLTLLSSILVDTDYREFGKAVARAELAMERLGAERRTLEGGSDLRGYRALAKIPSRNKKQESDMQQLEEALAKPMDTMKDMSTS